jgi:dTDP-glucose 4,6-dehydratase
MDELASQLKNIDYIFHIAANSDVGKIIARPLLALENIVSTFNCLEFSRKHLPNLKRFFYFNSGEAFGPSTMKEDSKESDAFNCISPYSASKGSGSLLALSYKRTYNLPVQVLNFINVFGPYQPCNKLIPTVIKNIKEDRVSQLYGDQSLNITSQRKWLHVEDLASFTNFLIKQDSIEINSVNVSFNEIISHLDLVNTIGSIMNKQPKVQIVSTEFSRPGHEFKYSLDDTLCRSLGWVPNYSFVDRLKQTIDWYIERY